MANVPDPYREIYDQLIIPYLSVGVPIVIEVLDVDKICTAFNMYHNLTDHKFKSEDQLFSIYLIGVRDVSSSEVRVRPLGCIPITTESSFRIRMMNECKNNPMYERIKSYRIRIVPIIKLL